MHCRLKDLLSQRLVECGWVEEVKERMQGQSISLTRAQWGSLSLPLQLAWLLLAAPPTDRLGHLQGS